MTFRAALKRNVGKLFDHKRKVPYLIFPPPDDIITESGAFYKATYTSREKGELLTRTVTEKIIEIANSELNQR